jgi:putative SOS response-associated peptidase YedK
MCNLCTLAPWEVRHLIRHDTLVGREFEEVMRGRVVPATAFSEPDRNTPKGAVAWRWFEQADKQPFFFAGIWRP